MSLQIKTNALTYRFLTQHTFPGWRRRGRQLTNLCAYMRWLVLLFVGTAVTYGAAILTVIGMVMVAGHLVAGWPIPETGIWVVALILGAFGWVLAIILALFFIGAGLFHAIFGAEKTEGVRKAIRYATRNNIFVRWYRAHKEQICPTIEYVG